MKESPFELMMKILKRLDLISDYKIESDIKNIEITPNNELIFDCCTNIYVMPKTTALKVNITLSTETL